MKTAAISFICRFLIASMLLLPFQSLQAGMIGTQQVAAASTAQADRAAVLGVMSRSEVASQLQALGVDVQSAKDRVAMMSDEEVRSLAGQLDSLPAGAMSGWGWAAIVIIIALILWYTYR
jgi:uncharacterized protein DUF6627